MTTTSMQFGQSTIDVVLNEGVSLVQAVTGPNGGVSGLQAGSSFVEKLPAAGSVPRGMSWLTDTINSFDIYKLGFVQRPTIFFDPQATDANGRGTFAKPYSTAAQLEAAINRLSKNNTDHIGGQVIGFKRGSKLHGGLRLKIAGASGDPVFVVPYGDAEALPIVTGAAVYALTENAATGWATTSDARVYKINSATEYDVFDTSYTPIYDQRFTKVAAGVDEAATIAAVVAGGAGSRSFLSGVLYIYPFDGIPDWTAIEINSVAHNTNTRIGLDIRYANIAASGFVTVAGIHVRSVGNMGLYATSLGSEYGNITSISEVQVVGCKIGNCGTDRASAGVDTGMAAGGIYGISDAIRVTNPLWAGNYCYNVENNGGEFGHTTRLIYEYNRTDYSNGPCCAELYQNNTDSIVRYNIGKGRRNKPFLSGTHGHKGIWMSGYGDVEGTRLAAQSDNNVFHHNVCLEVGDGTGCDVCGTNTLIYNNYIENDATTGGVQIKIVVGSDVPSTTTIKNNILNQTAGGSSGRNIMSAATNSETLSNNWYRRSNGTANIQIVVSGTLTVFDGLANIIAGVGADAAALGAATTFTSGRPATGAAVLTGGVAVAGYTEIDKDGVYSATPAIGAYYIGA